MTEPTDVGPSTADQLFRLIRSFGYTTHGQTAEIVDAIVAKWGTPPAVAGEPVAWLDPWTGAKVTTDYDAYGKHGIPLYTAPQPAQAQAGAVPLTDEQIVGVMHSIPINAAPSYHIAFARAIEAGHGIQGGHHDIE